VWNKLVSYIIHVVKRKYLPNCLIAQIIATDNRQFGIEKYVNGSTMCAFNNASEIITVRSRIECSSRCLQHGPMCNQFNTKVILNSTKISCELFMSPPTVFGVLDQCHLHQVRCSLRSITLCTKVYTIHTNTHFPEVDCKRPPFLPLSLWLTFYYHYEIPFWLPFVTLCTFVIMFSKSDAWIKTTVQIDV